MQNEQYKQLNISTFIVFTVNLSNIQLKSPFLTDNEQNIIIQVLKRQRLPVRQMDQEKEQKSLISILIVTELQKQQSVQYSRESIKTLSSENIFIIYTEDTNIFPQTTLYQKDKTEIKVDYIISIGENNTMMRAVRFQSKFYKNLIQEKKEKTNQITKSYNIPILSISDGDEPIMSSFSYCEIESVIKKFIQGVKKQQLPTVQVMRLDILDINRKTQMSSFCCQLQFHRDMKKSVLKLKIFAKIESKQFYHLANLWGDGLIISTPLGSMGRNINLSGPILYKSVQALIIVPISPLSLNFRPIILPANSQILIEVQETSRSSALMFADRQLQNNLNPGSQILIKRSPKNAQLIKGLSQKTSGQLWINCLRQVILWGQSYQDFEKKQKSASKL